MVIDKSNTHSKFNPVNHQDSMKQEGVLSQLIDLLDVEPQPGLASMPSPPILPPIPPEDSKKDEAFYVDSALLSKAIALDFSTGVPCSACTFLNDVFTTSCTMCGTPLAPPTVSTEPSTSSKVEIESKDDDLSAKLSDDLMDLKFSGKITNDTEEDSLSNVLKDLAQPDPEPEAKQWACVACTFLNDNMSTIACQICTTPRPPPPMPQVKTTKVNESSTAKPTVISSTTDLSITAPIEKPVERAKKVLPIKLQSKVLEVLRNFESKYLPFFFILIIFTAKFQVDMVELGLLRHLKNLLFLVDLQTEVIKTISYFEGKIRGYCS